MNQLLKLFAVVLILISSPSIKADTVFEIQTGKQNSASWQFTNLLSDVWKRKQVLLEKSQNKRTYFAPKYVNGFYKRFQNLNRKQCKLIVAPLKSITELPIAGMQIKIAVVLWQSYLVPINSQNGISQIGLNNGQKWLIPEGSLIMPTFLNSLKSKFTDASADMDPASKEFIQSINWTYSESKEINRSQKTFSSMGSSRDSFGNPVSREDIGSVQYGRQLELIESHEIPTILASGDEGFLFYEMIGPYYNLLDALGNQYQIVSLEKGFIQNLLKNTWFLEPFTISKLNVQTVGVTYALFVHETEDPEFVSALIEALAQQPSTYFPKSYLLENLSLNETKVISPLFLHESSIEFFKID